MKKTLITLLALGGLAMGADTQFSFLPQHSQGTETENMNGGTYRGITFSLTADSDRTDYTSTSSAVTFPESSSKLLSLNEIKIAGNSQRYPFTYTITPANEETGAAAVIGTYGLIVVDTSGQLIATSTSTAIASQKLPGFDYTRSVATFSFDNAIIAASTQYFAYFVSEAQMESVLKATSFTLTSSNFTSSTSSLSLSAYDADTASTYTDGANIYGLSNSFLGTNDVGYTPLAQINVSIPEPATATLSLLALAGLAARRRRK